MGCSRESNRFIFMSQQTVDHYILITCRCMNVVNLKVDNLNACQNCRLGIVQVSIRNLSKVGESRME